MGNWLQKISSVAGEIGDAAGKVGGAVSAVRSPGTSTAQQVTTPAETAVATQNRRLLIYIGAGVLALVAVVFLVRK